ncbi:arginine/serine-rich protein 1 [Syngnathoides biaculeatus]|uniref:arginine/serine-rich protein 1 n=1 Tax=Syngnathoides biaculeatus TaxID=300417 RepID=UPI002ADE206F|nr:arginine/serine-rich protein 1 [Syngnathoides biaculeatus]
MTKGEDSHLAMAHVQLSDEACGVFDQRSPSSYYSRNSYESSPSSSADSDRGRHRSSSSSDSSSSRSRSRSHPRCHRHSRCRSHRRNSRHHASRRYRAHSRSYSRSPSPDRYHRHHRRSTSNSRSRSRSRSAYARSRYSRVQGRFNRFPRSPSRSYRSPSRSSGSSVSLSVEDKKELLKVARTNAMKLLGVDKLELPESVKPILSEQMEKHKWTLPESEPRVRPHPEKISQSNEAEATVTSPKIAAKSKIITFSINNCVARPTLMAPSSAKLTARVDSYESRMPYGHWVPVMSAKSSRKRKQMVKDLLWEGVKNLSGGIISFP